MMHKKTFIHLEKLEINNSVQWVLVRGKNPEAPLLIHVQAGPGLPMISEASEIEKKLRLENNFLVAYWDQRGCGLSFSRDVLPETINLTQMADDLIDCTKYLLHKFNKSKALIVGYSIGATISLMAAVKNNSIFSAIVTAGLDVDIPYANHYALEFAMEKAVSKNDKKLMNKIAELKRVPIDENKRFQQRAEILSNLGGVKAGSSYYKLVLHSVKNMLFSKYYGISGIIKTMRGMAFCQNALLPEMNHFNLFKRVTNVSVPVHFIQGNLDGVAPATKGKEYFEQLQAIQKNFTLLERSAHLPQYEEPEIFSKLIVSIGSN